MSDLATAIREEQLDREPWIWVDRIRDHTQPSLDLDEILEEEGLRGDLVRLAEAWASDPKNAARALEEVLAPVLAQLTAHPQREIEPEQLIRSARDLCLDRLAGDGE
jgi:hypothetical protein